jgi:hypothetical protein
VVCVTEPDDVPIPRDVAAEELVLGACMGDPSAFRTASGILTEHDFWKPAHQQIWRHIAFSMADCGVADPVLVLDSMRTAGERRIGEIAPLLHSLYARAPIALECEHHARIVADLAVRRRVLQAGQRMIQRASSGTGELADLLESAAADIRDARNARKGVELLTMPIDEFMSAEMPEPDWLIPGLLARQDRFVLTGPGGLGKSTLLRQIAVCAAAGIAPLDWHTGEMFDPIRVTIIDCENADHQLKSALWPMLKECRDVQRPVEDRLMIGGHGSPIDLLDPASAMSVMRTVEHDRPDLVYIGPAYKLHLGDPDKEMHVKQVTAVLDQIRATGAAVICEAHPNNESSSKGGSLRPSGSGLWTWWPEFGRGLRLDTNALPEMRRCELEMWRIDRVARNWPEWLEAGGSWPWVRSS